MGQTRRSRESEDCMFSLPSNHSTLRSPSWQRRACRSATEPPGGPETVSIGIHFWFSSRRAREKIGTGRRFDQGVPKQATVLRVAQMLDYGAARSRKTRPSVVKMQRAVLLCQNRLHSSPTPTKAARADDSRGVQPHRSLVRDPRGTAVRVFPVGPVFCSDAF